MGVGRWDPQVSKQIDATVEKGRERKEEGKGRGGTGREAIFPRF